MIVKNSTKWNTDDLRAVLKVCSEKELEAPQRKGLLVYFKSARRLKRGGEQYRKSCSGLCYIGRNRVEIMIPTADVDIVDLAHVISHELAHHRGMTHAQMRNSPRYRRIGNWRELYSWVLEYQVRKEG